VKGHTYHNHYDVVHGLGLTHRITDYTAFSMVRTDYEAERDGECDRYEQYCLYSCRAHFMIETEPNTFTRLCTLDVLRYRPFSFMMHQMYFDIDKPKERQLTLWGYPFLEAA